MSDLGVLLSVPVLQSGFVTKEQADPVVPGVGASHPRAVLQVLKERCRDA